MTRLEARAALALALACLIVGGVWLFGPYALLAIGVLLAVLVLFVFDVKEQDGKAVVDPSGSQQSRGDQPVQLGPIHR